MGRHCVLSKSSQRVSSWCGKSLGVNKHPSSTSIVSGGHTQQEIDIVMEELTEKYQPLFQGLGEAKVESINIKVDPEVNTVEQTHKPIALQYKQIYK